MGHEMLNFHRLVPMIYPLHKKHGEFMEIYLVVIFLKGTWKFHVVIFSKQITRQKVIKHGSYLRLYLKSQLNEYQRMKQHNRKHKSRAGS